jgi:hypothetical protein
MRLDGRRGRRGALIPLGNDAVATRVGVYMPYIVKRHFKDGRVDRSPSIDDHAAAIGAATRAWKENPDLVEVTVEGELGRPIWVVSPDGTFSQRS